MRQHKTIICTKHTVVKHGHLQTKAESMIGVSEYKLFLQCDL